ncbi:MAG: hypothetical protein ABI672_07875, partial [Vicinamibacteria bacterium]
RLWRSHPKTTLEQCTGEAVLGRRLKELRLGGSVALRPRFFSSGVISASYSYALVEKSKVDIPNNRSNGLLDIGRSLGDRFSLHANVAWQRTHGGLRFGSISPTTTLPFPGEVGLNGKLEGLRFEEHDRLLRDNNWRVGGSLSYSLERMDVFASVSAYVAGTDAHDGESFTLGATWYFGGQPKGK